MFFNHLFPKQQENKTHRDQEIEVYINILQYLRDYQLNNLKDNTSI